MLTDNKLGRPILKTKNTFYNYYKSLVSQKE